MPPTPPPDHPSETPTRLPDGTPIELRAMYRALVEQIPAVLYINEPDSEATTVFVSPQTNTILQVPETEWFNSTWTTRVHPDDVDTMDRNYAEMLRSADVGVDEYRFVRPDGKTLWIHDRVTILRADDGTPLMVQGVMFDVTEQRQAEELARQQAQLMATIDEIARRFSDLLLGGSGLTEVLDTLAAIVDNPVLLEDAAHQLIAHSGTGTPVVDLLDRWQEHGRADHPDTHAHSSGALTAPGDPTCLWIPIRLRDEEWGRLHVLALESPIGELDHVAIDRAAAAVGLSLLSSREATQMAEQARSELIADVWQGRWSSAREVLARARSLGADLDATRLLCLVVEAAELTQAETPWDNATARRRALEQLLTATEQSLSAAGTPALCAVVGDLVIALTTHGSVTSRAGIATVADSLMARVADVLPDLTVIVGVSRPVTADQIRHGLTEAGEAAAHGARVERRAGTHHAEDLGLRRLLGLLGDGPELSRFVEAELGALLEADARGGKHHLATLRAYLTHGCSKARAAASLHVERRTLYYRLDRIEQLLGHRIDDPNARLRLEVALQALDILQQRQSRSS